jgi:hypothetical protein
MKNRKERVWKIYRDGATPFQYTFPLEILRFA